MAADTTQARRKAEVQAANATVAATLAMVDRALGALGVPAAPELPGTGELVALAWRLGVLTTQGPPPRRDGPGTLVEEIGTLVEEIEETLGLTSVPGGTLADRLRAAIGYLRAAIATADGADEDRPEADGGWYDPADQPEVGASVEAFTSASDSVRGRFVRVGADRVGVQSEAGEVLPWGAHIARWRFAG